MDGGRKGQNGDVARPFDGLRHLPLMFCTVSGDPSGNDLSPFRDEIPENLRVLIIDVQFLIRAESANLPPQKRFFLPVGSRILSDPGLSIGFLILFSLFF